MSDATMLNDDDLRVFAQEELASHTPANQENNGYERCALCHFTRHPCDVYDLAAGVLRLLDRLDKMQLAYIEATNPGINMDEVRKIRCTSACSEMHTYVAPCELALPSESPISEWNAEDDIEDGTGATGGVPR